MQEEQLAANAEPEKAQTSFAREENFSAEPSEAFTFAGTEASVQATERTRAFSERLKQKSQECVDKFVAGLGLTDSYRDNQPITTQKEYQSFRERQAAEGDLPLDGSELGRLRDEVAHYRAQERDRQLLSDPVRGATYRQVRDDVQALMEVCRDNGTPVGLDAAFSTVLNDQHFALQQQAVEQARQEALRTVEANAKASPGALGGEQSTDRPDFLHMPSEEFARYMQMARSGEMRNL